MEIAKICNSFEVRRLQADDIESVLSICHSNPQFYEYDPPVATIESIKKDRQALPPKYQSRK